MTALIAILPGRNRLERRKSPPAPADPIGDDIDGDSDRARITRNEIFDVLRASRRRWVLYYLDTETEETTVGTLAEYIAAEENDVDALSLTSAQRKRVYVGLYQNHLPLLDKTGMIEYNQERGIVRLAEASRWCFPYLYLDPTAAGNNRGRGSRSGPLARRIARRIRHLVASVLE